MTELPPLSPTKRSTPNRSKHRTVTDRPALYEVLDAGLICHLGLMVNGSPMVLPTGYGRDGDTLYLHGSTGARSLRAATDGAPVCVTVTMVDGIVYARSLMHHSMNYRSAVVHGIARPVTERAEKLHGLRVITEHLSPGSWDYARDVSAKEYASVAVLALELREASVKVRAAGPGDDDADLDLPVWAGVLPVHRTFGTPVPAEDLPPGVELPAHVAQRSDSRPQSVTNMNTIRVSAADHWAEQPSR